MTEIVQISLISSLIAATIAVIAVVLDDYLYNSDRFNIGKFDNQRD